MDDNLPRVEKEKMTTYTEGGRGRKQCPKCEVYLGVRVAECECGHEFGKATAEKKEQVTDPGTILARREANMFGWAGRITLTPAGACPVKLKDTNEDTVHAWCEHVISIWQQEERSFLCSKAMRYFAHEFYDIFGSDYQAVKGHILTYFGSPPELDDEDAPVRTIPVYDAEADAEIENSEVEIDNDIMGAPYKPVEGKDLEKAIKDARTSEENIDI